MSAISWNKINYVLGDLIDFRDANRLDTPLSIAILIKAGRIQYREATELLQHFHQHWVGDNEHKLRSATMKLIYKNDLYHNFTRDNYNDEALDDAILTEFDVVKENICGFNQSDYKLMKALANKFTCEDHLSGKEMLIIEKIKDEFRNIVNIDLGEMFSLKYTTEHIRYISQHKFPNLQKDHVVELQIINKVCHDCNYDVTDAARLAWHFNDRSNIKLIDEATNQAKGHAVTQFLNHGKTSAFVNEIKYQYWQLIRKNVRDSIKSHEENYHEAMQELDNLLQ